MTRVFLRAWRASDALQTIYKRYNVSHGGLLSQCAFFKRFRRVSDKCLTSVKNEQCDSRITGVCVALSRESQQALTQNYTCYYTTVGINQLFYDDGNSRKHPSNNCENNEAHTTMMMGMRKMTSRTSVCAHSLSASTYYYKTAWLHLYKNVT